jgi:hypothetical protein
MALAQLLQPWADEWWNTTGIAMKNQGGGGQRPQSEAAIRRESPAWCEACAKLIRPDFTQSIDTHWRKRKLELKRITNSSWIPE